MPKKNKNKLNFKVFVVKHDNHFKNNLTEEIIFNYNTALKEKKKQCRICFKKSTWFYLQDS
jgi:hypothetical protein